MLGTIVSLRVVSSCCGSGLLLPATAQRRANGPSSRHFRARGRAARRSGKRQDVVSFAVSLRGEAIGMIYEYDPANDKWAKKKPMPLLSHHVALPSTAGKIYAFGGFVLPATGAPAWVPVDKRVGIRYGCRTPGKRGALAHQARFADRGDGGRQDLRYRRRDHASRLQGNGRAPARPHVSVGTVEEYDPATNSWRARSSMPTPRNHATSGVVNGKIYVIGGRVGAAFISAGSRTSTSSRNMTRPPMLGSARARCVGAQRDGVGVYGGASMSRAARARIARGCTRFARASIRSGEQPMEVLPSMRSRATDWRAPSSASACTWLAVSAVGAVRRGGAHRFARRIRV